MSAREIIAEIEALPENEKAMVVDYVTHLKPQSTGAESKQIRYMSDEDFERAQDEVFSKHAPLLKKLAQ